VGRESGGGKIRFWMGARHWGNSPGCNGDTRKPRKLGSSTSTRPPSSDDGPPRFGLRRRLRAPRLPVGADVVGEAGGQAPDVGLDAVQFARCRLHLARSPLSPAPNTRGRPSPPRIPLTRVTRIT